MGAEVHGGGADAQRDDRGHHGQHPAGDPGGSQVGQDSPGHHGVGGVTGREYIATGEEFGGSDLRGVVRTEPAEAELDGPDGDVEQQQCHAEGDQRAEGVLPPGAPAEPGGDHDRGGSALAQHDQIVEEGVQLRPLLVGPEEHDLPVQADQPGSGQYGDHDGEIEGEGRSQEYDAVPAHLRGLQMSRSLWFPVQPGEHPLQTGQDLVGTHSIDVTARRWSARANRGLCDDHVMWSWSHVGANSRYFDSGWRLLDPLPRRIDSVTYPDFIAARVISFAERWTGMIHSVMWGLYGGPEPFSQNAP